MGAACGLSHSQTQKLKPDTDHKVAYNRTIANQPMLKPKDINMNRPSISLSHSLTTPITPIPSLIPPLQSLKVTDGDESDASIEAFDDEYLFQSSLILTQLFENDHDQQLFKNQTFLESCKCGGITIKSHINQCMGCDRDALDDNIICVVCTKCGETKHNISIIECDKNKNNVNHVQPVISSQNDFKVMAKPNLFRPDTNTAWDMNEMDDLKNEMEQELKSMVISHEKIDQFNRNKWKIGSKVEIYSDSKSKWIKGKIIEIINDDQGEWLVVKYEGFNRKEIQRYNKSIRPIDRDIIGREQDQKSVPFFVSHPNENERGSNLIATFSHDWDSEDMDIEENQMKKHLDHLILENENSNQA